MLAIWKVNEQFIDEHIVASKKILLSNNPDKEYYFSDGTRRFYQRELDDITSQRYEFEKISDDLWHAIKNRYKYFVLLRKRMFNIITLADAKEMYLKYDCSLFVLAREEVHQKNY